MLIVTDLIRIPLRELEFSYARSSGPGGQNVNKVNSKAVLRWAPRACATLSLGVLVRFLEAYGSQLTVEGHIVLSSDRFRDQGRNVDDCLEKLRVMLLAVAYPPKVRKKTKPTYGSKVRRQDTKRAHGRKKSQRGRVSHDD